MKNYKVYLAGPICGLTYEGAEGWRDDFSKRIDPRIECFSPLRGKEYLTMRGPLEGSYSEFPLSTDRGITTRDRNDCMGSDLVVFNMLGAKRVSLGTMVEFGWADAARVPSILIMEKEGNPHEYPMVREIAGFRVDNVEDAISIAEIILLNKATPKRIRGGGRMSNETYTDKPQVNHAETANQWLADNEYDSNFEVVVAKRDQLMLDYDRTTLPTDFKVVMDILKQSMKMDKDPEYEVSTSKRGNLHVIINLPRSISDYCRVAWQGAFGSDPKREALHLLSMSRHELNPILLYNRKKVLM